MPATGQNMRMLRDLRLSTKVLILYEMLKEPGTGQRDMAEALEVTPQAISEYLKHMEAEGLVEREGRAVRPTMVGFQFMQEHLQELGEFTYRAMREVNVINSCSAIAAEEINEGDGVVLELVDGSIIARRGDEGASRGVALRDASEGEDLAVGSLEGILTYEPGSVTIASLPSVFEGGTSIVEVDSLRAKTKDIEPGVVAVLDPVGKVTADKLGMSIDIRFGVDRAVVDAALRGIDVLVLGGRDSVGGVIEAIETHNKRGDARIDHSVIDVARD